MVFIQNLHFLLYSWFNFVKEDIFGNTVRIALLAFSPFACFLFPTFDHPCCFLLPLLIISYFLSCPPLLNPPFPLFLLAAILRLLQRADLLAGRRGWGACVKLLTHIMVYLTGIRSTKTHTAITHLPSPCGRCVCVCMLWQLSFKDYLSAHEAVCVLVHTR